MPGSTVYVETTVIGHLVGRILADPIVAGRQTVTRLWWPQAQAKHRLFISSVVADECGAGDPAAAAERLTVANALQFLATTAEAHDLAARLISGHAVPGTELRDAVHISIAAVHGIEYLVTWNFKHIANPATRSSIERICEREGYRPPLICTPDELSEIQNDS
jgi:predicted nucleic acid-binding protein